MPVLYCRDVPEELYRELGERAREHGTSISREAIRLLERAMGYERRGVGLLIDEIVRERGRLRPGAPSAAELIRSDRER